jgi:homoprotocatechuate degradation regulator HpaR
LTGKPKRHLLQCEYAIWDAGAEMSQSKARAVKSSAKSARQVPMRDFSQSLPMALLRAREAVMRQFRPSLRAHGLTEQQWRILRALAAVDVIEVTELARVAFLLGPSLSRILRDLEARGLIERESDIRDLRRGVLSISAKGLKLIAQVAPSSEAIYASIASRYGVRKLAALQKMLAELEDSLANFGEPEESGDV